MRYLDPVIQNMKLNESEVRRIYKERLTTSDGSIDVEKLLTKLMEIEEKLNRPLQLPTPRFGWSPEQGQD